MTTYDVAFGEYKLGHYLITLFCNDTVGNCHFKIEDFYSNFYSFGSFIYSFFGQTKISFIIGQIIILLIYYLFIWTLFYLIKRCVRIISFILRRKKKE